MRNQETVLVTGGNGYIGNHLVQKLIAMGKFRVFSLDIQSTSNTKGLNVEHLTCDLTKYDQVLGLPDFDYIFHLAAINGTQRFYAEPWNVFYNSLVSTINLIEKFKSSTRLNRFVYTSSSEVYADRFIYKNFSSKSNESIGVGFNDVLNPRWSYGGAKLAGEIALNSAFHEYKLPFTILRYHNVYGPAMGPNHVIPDFIARGRKGIFSLAGSENVRSFIYVSDAIEATILSSFSENTVGKIVHIGNEDPVSMMDLAKLIMRLAGWSGKIVVEDAPSGSTSFRCPDVGFLRKLGFSPTIDLASGIKQVLSKSDDQ